MVIITTVHIFYVHSLSLTPTIDDIFDYIIIIAVSYVSICDKFEGGAKYGSESGGEVGDTKNNTYVTDNNIMSVLTCALYSLVFTSVLAHPPTHHLTSK